MGNKVLDVFSFNNFFVRSNIFRENGEKIFLGGMTILGEGPSYAKNEKNLFYQTLDAKYFYVTQFF